MNTYLGVFAAILAGAMWGISFVAARSVTPFTELDLAVFRTAIFGALSIGLMIHPAFRPTGLTPKQIGTSILLGFIGYVGIFLAVSFASGNAGAAIPPLIIGLLPVLLSLVGNWRERIVPWKVLAFPLSLIGVGALLINVWAFKGAAESIDYPNILLGVICSISALAMWILYGAVNARAMRVDNPPRALPWTSLHGVGAAIGCFFLVCLILITKDTGLSEHSLKSPEGRNFLVWTLISGIGGSWVAAWSWAIASRNLPLVLAAQLLVAEVVFGLLYGFIFERRWPNLEEWIGATLMISGVIVAIKRYELGKIKQPVAKVTTLAD